MLEQQSVCASFAVNWPEFHLFCLMFSFVWKHMRCWYKMLWLNYVYLVVLLCLMLGSRLHLSEMKFYEVLRCFIALLCSPWTMDAMEMWGIGAKFNKLDCYCLHKGFTWFHLYNLCIKKIFLFKLFVQIVHNQWCINECFYQSSNTTMNSTHIHLMSSLEKIFGVCVFFILARVCYLIQFNFSFFFCVCCFGLASTTSHNARAILWRTFSVAQFSIQCDY